MHDPTVPLSAKHFNVNIPAWYEPTRRLPSARSRRSLSSSSSNCVEYVRPTVTRKFESIHRIEGHTEAPDLQING